ncbi:MAG: SH3 domain-containing protein [Clostridia bacterium]|nr:SH3 domain-containing protein [Clostridia bacterium]
MKKFLCLLLALCAIFSLTASAEVPPPTIYAKVTPAPTDNFYTPATINVYQLPGEYRPVIGTLSSGEQIIVVFEGSTWHKVRTLSSKVVGWVRDMDITFTTRGYSAANLGCTLPSAALVQSSDGFASLRWGPATYYDEMDKLPNGRYVWRYENEDGWTRVLLEDGRCGYVHSSLLKNTKLLTTWPSGLHAYVQVTGDYAIFRKSANYSSASLGSYKSGTVLEIIGQQGSFYQFVNPANGTSAYISYDIVSPECLNETVSQSSVYYDHPLMYACDVITSIPAGTKLKVMATDGYVSYVKYATGEGYVYDYTLKY